MEGAGCGMEAEGAVIGWMGGGGGGTGIRGGGFGGGAGIIGGGRRGTRLKDGICMTHG